MHYLLALVLTISFAAFSANAEDSDVCSNSTDCIEIGRWDIGIALGYGNKSNPLKDFNDIPIYAVPTIAYYGDNWFFDNGNIGYTLTEGENYTINLVTAFSNDSAFFPAGIPLISLFLEGAILESQCQQPWQ